MTEQCLQHLNQHTHRPDISIHVVDNGSAADLDRLKELQAQGQFDELIQHPQNLGFSRAFNLAVDATHGDFFCFVSTDCLVESGWLEALLKTLHSDPRIAVANANVYHRDERRKIVEDQFVEHLYGAIMLIRRSAWNAIGSFDAKNFSPAYGEELDWGYRAIRMGYRMKLSGNCVARHVISYTTQKNYDPVDIRIVRLTHRIKCRLFNWSLKQLLFTSWKSYYYELEFEIKNRTLRLLFLAFLKNLLMIQTILAERQKRASVAKIAF